MPLEATLLLFLGTPQSTFPRDVSLDLNFNPRKLILKITHPLKTILIQGFKRTLFFMYILNVLYSNVLYVYRFGVTSQRANTKSTNTRTQVGFNSGLVRTKCESSIKNINIMRNINYINVLQ